MQRLRDSSKQNPTTLRNFIQYEVLQEKTIFNSYRTFCKVLGNDAMDYSEFELWYWRFYNGEVDTDYDISLDRKPLELLKLPLEIVDKVVESLEPSHRLITRRVSKTFQSIIDNQKLKLPCIQIDAHYSDDNVVMRFNPDPIWGEYSSIVLDRTVDALTEVSSAMNHKLHVKELCIRSGKPEQIASCLSLLKPNVLEVIDLNQYSEAITNTEQWQNAKIVKVDFKVEFTAMDVGNFRNFPEFHIFLSRISRNKMVQLRDILLKFPLFKKCKLEFSKKTQFTIDNIAAAFGVAVQNQIVHVPIDGSDDMLQIRVDALPFKYIEIERKKADINVFL